MAEHDDILQRARALRGDAKRARTTTRVPVVQGPSITDMRPDLAPERDPFDYPGGNLLTDAANRYIQDPDADTRNVPISVEQGFGPRIQSGRGINVRGQFTSPNAAHRYYMQNRPQPQQPEGVRPDPALVAEAEAGLAAAPPTLPAAPMDVRRRHAEGRKAAAAARREGFNVTYDKQTGQLDRSKHDARAEGVRLKKIEQTRRRKAGKQWDPATSEAIPLAIPSQEMTDTSGFTEGQKYIDPVLVPDHVDPDTGQGIPAHYESRLTVWKDGQMQPVPEAEMSLDERREQRLRERLAFDQQKFGATQENRQVSLNIRIADAVRRLSESGVQMSPEEHGQVAKFEERVNRSNERLKAASIQLSEYQSQLQDAMTAGGDYDEDDVEDITPMLVAAQRQYDALVKRRGELETQYGEFKEELVQRAQEFIATGEAGQRKAAEAPGAYGAGTPSAPQPAKQAAPEQATATLYSPILKKPVTIKMIESYAQRKGLSLNEVYDVLGIPRP